MSEIAATFDCRAADVASAMEKLLRPRAEVSGEMSPAEVLRRVDFGVAAFGDFRGAAAELFFEGGFFIGMRFKMKPERSLRASLIPALNEF